MHINLIFKDEQRSASPVSLALMIRVALGALLFMIAFGIFMFAVEYRACQNQVEMANDEWKRTEPKYKAAIEVRNELAGRMDTLKALQGWRDARIAWGRQLDTVVPVVPHVIQLTQIRVSQTVVVVSNTIPARVFEMKFSGRTPADRSEVNVVQFLDAFKGTPFSQFVESATLPPGAFRQDPLEKNDRIFEVVCKYYPRPIE
ncbi:MAG: hypothetical protein WCO42_03065 [bacterium]